MKRGLVLLLCFIMILSLSSCTRDEYINLVDFIDIWNECNGKASLLLTDFEKVSATADYSVYIKSYDEDISIILYALSDGTLSHAKIIIANKKENGDDVFFSDEKKKAFTEASIKTVMAFCQLDKSKAEKIVSVFNFSDTENAFSEQLKEEGSFNYLFISGSLCREFVVYNKWLYDIGQTRKPESKPGFPQNPSIRNETVPHR